ncbi:hypothetical protein [Flavobacterium sedimenticola]|uniref:Uncharacterized protein n=1 Tax=Flavobacterium sedimenticola TaxID=3043286 RepID=A0ABT6XME1_9FLAO|nr:hypothetical protein [Flavobacterium sedimenticola]MDI9256140.1 hypothetical protein [Flavobacterium sedimenticola]
MKKFLLVISLSIVSLGFSQEVKLKKDQVFVDDQHWLNSDGCGMFSSTCSLTNLSGDEIIYMKYIELKGVEPITNYNKTGNVSYTEIKFLGFNVSIELQETYKKIIKILYAAKVVNPDGTLDEEKVQKLVEKYGNAFSERYNKTTNNTIIINNNQEPQRSGVNINLGR